MSADRMGARRKRLARIREAVATIERPIYVWMNNGSDDEMRYALVNALRAARQLARLAREGR